MTKQPLTHSDFDSINRDESLRDVLIFRLLYETGCTLTELTKIRVKDISLQRSTISLGQPRRTLPVRKGVIRLIVTYAKNTTKGSYILSTRESPQISPRRVQQILSALGKRTIQQKITPSTIRYTRIIHDFLNQVPVQEIEKSAGLQTIQPHLYKYFSERWSQ